MNEQDDLYAHERTCECPKCAGQPEDWEPVAKAEHEPWSKWRGNRQFLKRLLDMFGDQTFTNQQAYVIYAVWHSKTAQGPHYEIKSVEDPRYLELALKDNFLTMNVRNHLSAYTYWGILIREQRGVYRFAPVSSYD